MYKYNHDCPFEAFITNLNAYNGGKLIGEWIKLPIDPVHLRYVFEKLNINDQNDWFISDYDIYVDNLSPFSLGEFPSIEELNSIAKEYLHDEENGT